MPNHKSAEKRVRQSERRRVINRSNRARLRTSVKNLRASLSKGDGKDAAELLPKTVSRHGGQAFLREQHRNAAARHKSRLTARVTQAAK